MGHGQFLQIAAAVQFGLTGLFLMVAWLRGAFDLGPDWTPEHTRDGWIMRRKVDGKIETRPATETEAADAQADADYDWWATR